MHPNLVTYFFLALGAGAFIAWLRERRRTELYGTVAESLGLFLFSAAPSSSPLGCAPSPEPRKLHDYPAGTAFASFEFAPDRVFCLAFKVSGSLLRKRHRIHLVLTPGSDPDALHVTLSADARPPVFDGEVRLAEATKEEAYFLGQP